MALAALLLLLLGGVLVWLALRLRKNTGLPWATVRSQDTVGQPTDRPLFSRRYGLTGRPDYLIERGGTLIPVEVKPGRRSPQPYDSDLMQLAAYCLLVEETSGRAPPYGLLRYADTTFRLDYTAAVREDLLAVLDEMHEALEAEDWERSHDERRRCAACSFADVCDESLA